MQCTDRSKVYIIMYYRKINTMQLIPESTELMGETAIF